MSVDRQKHIDMTLGTVQLGIKYGAANVTGLPAEEEAVDIIRKSVEAGITSIDCARAYGLAERRVGIALKGLQNSLEVITKLDPLAELEPDASEETVRQAVDASVFRSCQELGLKCLNTLLLHRWVHRYLYDEIIWTRLLELKREGFIGRLGVSVYTPEEAIKALGDSDINHIQLPFNILDRRWKDAGIEDAVSQRTDVVIHARSALLQGILSAESAYWPHIEGLDTEKLIETMDNLVKVLSRQSRTDLCFAYVRSQPWVSSIVIGLETLAQLYDNIKLFEKPPLNKKECTIAEEYLKEVPVELLNPSMWNKK